MKKLNSTKAAINNPIIKLVLPAAMTFIAMSSTAVVFAQPGNNVLTLPLTNMQVSSNSLPSSGSPTSSGITVSAGPVVVSATPGISAPPNVSAPGGNVVSSLVNFFSVNASSAPAARPP